MATNSISSYSHKGVREAEFVHPSVTDPIGVFNIALLRRIDPKLAGEVTTLWEKYAHRVEKFNETRIAELDKLIAAKNSECRVFSDKLAKAQERSQNAKVDAINADLHVSDTYNTIGNVRNVALPKFPSESERNMKQKVIASAEQDHREALENQKRAESTFNKHAHAIVDIAKSFQVSINDLENYQDEYKQLNGGKRHELDQRNPRDIKRMNGLPI